MWYFIPVQHFQEDRDALRKAGVAFFDRAVKVDQAVRAGILVDTDNFQQALDVLGLIEIDEAYRKVASEGAITVLEVYDCPDYDAAIAIEGNQQQYSSGRTLEVIEEAQQAMGRQVIVRYCKQRQSSACTHNDRVQLQLWSWPRQVQVAVSDQQWQAYEQTVVPLTGDFSEFQLLFADNCPHPIALLRDDGNTFTVWITFNTFGRNNKTHTLFQFVLHWATSIVTNPTEPPPTWRDFQLFQRRCAFLEHCQARLQVEVREIDGDIKDAEAELDAARQQFMTAYRKLNILQHRRMALEGGDEAVIRHFMEQYAKEYDDISASPYLTEFELTSTELTFTTVPLEIIHAGYVYSVGVFKVTIQLTNGNVHIQGRHPHVEGSRPCLGNIQADVAKLIASRKYGVLVVLLIRYLQSVDVSDQWGARIFTMNLPKRKVGSSWPPQMC